MAIKFTIAVKVQDGQIIETLTKPRTDAQTVITAFKKWRDEGFEAHLFSAPEADKRCKQGEGQVLATEPTLVQNVVNAMTKKKSKTSVESLDIE
jgi:hypothetical protein